jgi:cell division inhibitor SulA/protein ImuA
VLDRHLPGGGWPLGALSELLTQTSGGGEFSVLLPALASLTGRGQWVALVDPPWIPYPPAMQGHGVRLDHLMLIRTHNPQESLWACEQVLRGMGGGAVLAWQENPGFARLRRLQLAARSGHKAAFLFRPLQAGRQPSPAALRLELEVDTHGTRITVLKCQGHRPTGTLLVRRPACLPGAAHLPVLNQQQPPGHLAAACAQQAAATFTEESKHADLRKHGQDTPVAGHPVPAPGPGPDHP